MTMWVGLDESNQIKINHYYSYQNKLEILTHKSYKKLIVLLTTEKQAANQNRKINKQNKFLFFLIFRTGLLILGHGNSFTQ